MSARGGGGRPPAARTERPRRPVSLRPARPGGGVRRTRSVRRRSAGLTPTRAGALLALLAAIAGLYGAVSSGAFSLGRVEVTGTTWTTEDAVLAAMALPGDQNLFVLRTGSLEAAVAGIPAVHSAAVSVALPDTVRVDVREREALLVWQVGARRFLVDETGLLFGELPGDPPPEAARLPLVDDRRGESASYDVGSALDPVTLDAALRIGSLRPADLGSAASRLEIRLDDSVGFVVKAQPFGWSAVFGFYTPTLRKTDLVAGQARLLRSLILGREEEVLRVILADDRSGTYVPRKTPEPSPTAKS